MQLFSVDATIFRKKNVHENIKNYPQKSWQFIAVWILFLCSPDCPELKIHIRNVAKDTSVYYSVSAYST